MDKKKFETYKFLLISFSLSVATSLPLLAIFFFQTIPSIRDLAMEGKVGEIKAHAEIAHSLVKSVYERFKAGELSEDQAKQLAIESVKQLRYAEKEYFWINDSQPRMIMHPFKPEMNGTSLAEVVDPNGTKIFMEMVAVTKKSKAGTVAYMWPRAGDKTPIPKRSYVILFEPWGWIIGTGLYVDDVDTTVNRIKKTAVLLIALATFGIIFFSLFVSFKQLKKFIFPVQDALATLNGLTQLVETSSKEIDSAAQELSHSGKNQSEAIAAMASSLSEMSATATSTAERAKTTLASTDQTAISSRDGQTNMIALTATVDRIDRLVRDMYTLFEKHSERLSLLVEKVSAVKIKTKLIEDIVFQTKILSFNASVEAARAGDHGKGFSVVAEEIGLLARQSGTSAIEINNIVDDAAIFAKQLIESTSQEIGGMERNMDATLVEGREMTAKCREALETIVNLAGRSQQMSTEIQNAVHEQAKAIAHMEQQSSNLEMELRKTKQQIDDVGHQSVELDQRSSEMVGVVHSLARVVAQKIDEKKVA